MHAIICLRHGYAVYKIAMAIRQGTCGNCYLYIDAEDHERFLRAAANHNQTALPLWVWAQTPSRPDIVPYPSMSKTVSEADLLSFTPEQRSHHSFILLEVSFAGDANLHRRARDKCDEHAQLRQILLDFCWGTVKVLPLIIGHDGTIPATFSTALQFCGVEHHRLADLLFDLQYAAIDYSSHFLAAQYKATKRLRTDHAPLANDSPPVAAAFPAGRTSIPCPVRPPVRCQHSTTNAPVHLPCPMFPITLVMIQEGLTEVIPRQGR